MVSVDQRKMNAVRAYFEWMPIRYVTCNLDYDYLLSEPPPQMLHI